MKLSTAPLYVRPTVLLLIWVICLSLLWCDEIPCRHDGDGSPATESFCGSWGVHEHGSASAEPHQCAGVCACLCHLPIIGSGSGSVVNQFESTPHVAGYLAEPFSTPPLSVYHPPKA